MPTPSVELARRSHEVLMRAMEREPRDRRAFAREVCAGDDALLARVIGLLDAMDRSSTFLEKPALEVAEEKPASIPDAVGNYLVVGVLGVGGMATVYEAVQENPGRRVALKVLHQSVSNVSAYQRFRFETEALARLHHPGIAQIYEAGAARLGAGAASPFFAMELIPDATPITEYADKRGLSCRERVALLIQVCDAVHHGHQHGVIHRDIKPANVLVDGEGRPKVIDFGIARATDATSESLTMVGGVRQLLGTLQYMSPEQCGGDAGGAGAEGASESDGSGIGADLDIRTDVYSLGVLLYRLVYGGPPRELDGLPLPAALRRIVDEPAKRPDHAGRREDRDLEAVVFKAMERAPDRRYDSAAALAADLRRWLDGEGLEARPPGLADQIRLFAKRNRGVVAALIAVISSVVLIAMVSIVFVVLMGEEVRQRRAAEAQTIRERDAALWQAYTAQIAGALSAMNTGEFQRMRSRLASASHEKRGWEWGFLTRLSERSLRAHRAHDDMVMDLAVSPDWTRMLTAGADGTARLWHIAGASGNWEISPVAMFSLENGERMTAVAFDDNGKFVYTGSGGGVVRAHDAGDMSVISVLGESGATVRSVVGLSDGRVAAAWGNGNATCWTFEHCDDGPAWIGKELPTDQPGGIRGLSVSNQGWNIATYNDAGEVWVRNADDFGVSRRFRFPGAVHQVRFSTDGKYIGGAGESARLIVWDIERGSVLHDLEATGGVRTVRSLAFSNDGRFVVAGLVHRGIVVCSMADGSIVGEFAGHTEAISGVRFSPGDDVLVSSSWDRSIRVWRASEHAFSAVGVTLRGHTGYLFCAEFSQVGGMLATGSRDGTVRVWDPDLGEELAKIHGWGGPAYAVAFSPDGTLLAVGCGDGTVRLFSTATGAEVVRMEGHERWVASLAFDADGRRLISGSQDMTARVWDVRSGSMLHVLEVHTARVNGVRFSPDGRTVATVSRDRGVRLWDAGTGEMVADLPGHESDVFDVLFSKDGELMFTGCRDQTIRVWDVKTQACVRVLDGHGQFITSLSLSGDGTRLAAGSWIGEVLLFDVESLDLIATFRAHDAAVRGVSFSPDGRWLATGSYDGTARLLDSWCRVEADAARDVAVKELEAAMRTAWDAVGRGVDFHAKDHAFIGWTRKALLALHSSGVLDR